jgi:hypothetical protein
MSFRHTLLMCAAALISQFALAATPPTAHGAPLMSRPTTNQIPTPVVQQVGLVEAVVEFCSKVDPADKKLFERKGKQMLPKLSEDSLERIRRRAEYHTAYQFIQSVLQTLSKTDAEHNCLAIR